MTPTLPAGLRFHCAGCEIVVPSDVPEVPDALANCARVTRAKLGWFNPKETLAGQHIMAAAAWALIYEDALKAGHGKACEYVRRIHRDRKALYAGSAVRVAMTPEHVAAEAQHRRDGWLHK